MAFLKRYPVIIATSMLIAMKPRDTASQKPFADTAAANARNGMVSIRKSVMGLSRSARFLKNGVMSVNGLVSS